MRRIPHLNFKLLIFFFSLFLADRLSKHWALRVLSLRIIDLSLLRLRLVRNTGSLFGIGKEWPLFWLILSFFIFIVLFFYFLKDFRRLKALSRNCLLLIMMGALSNIVDRVIYGWVIDFIDLRIWPVFNLADSYITLGVVLLSYDVFFGSKKSHNS